MQQMADWLKELGLSEYTQRFAENDIDIAVLPHLTDQHLKELGVSLGHRLKMLHAVAQIAGAVPATPQRAPVIEPRPQDTAERRHLTVVFCDLVGSTALSTRLDPEDLRGIVGAYHRCCAEVIAKSGGFVARYMGDGVLAYFGYPQAHEDDAERSVRAGLQLVEAVSKIADGAGTALRVRVGIATGLVVVGDLLSEGSVQEHEVVGETPNIAARLQALAEADTVVIAESTRKLVGNLFELQDLGPKNLKGVADLVQTWVALRPSSVEDRFEALHASDLTALVGREEELELLLRRWANMKTRRGQVVLLSGEAGIGKSRLAAALLERLKTEPHLPLRYFGSPQHTESALYPVIGQMIRAAGISHDDAPHVRLDKLDELFERTSISKQDAALFADLLSLPNDGRYPPLNLTPQQQRQRTLEALISQLEALTRLSPVLMIFEDAHWSDPTSLEVLGWVIDRIRTLRVLLIVTFRPEFEPPWIGRHHVTLLTINRLGQRDANAMIDQIVGSKLLPESIRQDIIERTDGIPLFVEEMTSAVLEARTLDTAERVVAALPPPALAVPASLYASLMARLDRLGPAKELAQIGAAIGREFPSTLLAAVVQKSADQLESTLLHLVQSGLLFQRGAPPQATYLFKHALIQDVAYGTLLRKQRRELHARIAEILQSQFAEIAENQPELLARHYTEAGLIDKAVGLWGKAGRRSLQRSALIEAAAQFTRALHQIATLPSTPALRREEIEIQVGLITPLLHVKGYAAPETRAAAERARLLIEQAEAIGEPPQDPLLLFSVLYGFWAANFVAFRGDEMRGFATQFFELAKSQGAIIPLIAGHRVMGGSLLFTGDAAEGRAHFNEAIALYDPSRHRPLAERFGQDVRVTSLSFRSWAQWLLGYPEASLVDANQALRDAREICQAATSIFALTAASFTHILLGSCAEAITLLDEVVALADEKNAVGWKALGTAFKGCALSLTDKAPEAIHMITTGMNGWRSTGATVFGPLFFVYLARAHAALNELDDARRCISEALVTIGTTKESWCEPEVHRIAGEIALNSRLPELAKAEAYFDRALTVARAHKAKSWELRATMSMARLWREHRDPQQARDLLAPVCGWFTEGHDTYDLREAKALLHALVALT